MAAEGEECSPAEVPGVVFRSGPEPDARLEARAGVGGAVARDLDPARDLPAEDAAERRRARESAARAGSQYVATYRIRPGPGDRERWIQERGRPVRAPDGAVAGFEGFLEEVTEAIEIARLRDPERSKLRGVLEAAPMLVFAIDAEGRVVFAEGRALDSLDVGDLDGRSLFDAFADRPEVLESLRRGLAGEPQTSLSTVGDTVLETRLTPLRDHDGAPSGALGISLDVTARERALRRAREGEERFRALVHSTAELVAVMDDQSRYRYLSPRYATDLGYDPHAMLGAVAASLIHPDDLPDVVRRFRDSIDRGEVFHGFFRQRHRNGSWRWLEGSSSPFHTSQGALRVIAVFRDVTERVHQQELLERQRLIDLRISQLSHRFLALPVDEIDRGIREGLDVALEIAGADRGYLLGRDAGRPLVIATGGSVAELESVARELVPGSTERFTWSAGRLARGEILQIPDPAALPPEARRDAEDLVRRGVRSLLGIPVMTGDRLTAFLGLECLESARSWSDHEIERIRLVAELFSSVLHRLGAERALARQLEIERRVAELSHHFLGLDADGLAGSLVGGLETVARLFGAERAVLASFGSETSPPLGRRGSQPFGQFEWCAAGVASAEVQALPWTGRQVLAGATILARDPSELPPEASDERRDLGARGVASWVGIPILSGSRPIGYLALETLGGPAPWSLQDVGTLRLVGEVFGSALRRMRVEQALRTSQNQLLHSQKMEAVGRLAGGIAHDFNNLLTVILGFGRALLRDLGDDDPAREDIGEIQAAAERAAGLTRQLLTFSRRELATSESVDPDEVVHGLEPMLMRLLGEDVALVIEPGPVGERVQLDRVHLEQVLVNLAVNARDAMPDGGRIEIRSELRQVSDLDAMRLGLGQSGAFAVLSVADTGEGLDEEVQELVFEPFFTTKDPGKGTGLGLSIVYGVVRECGGGIELESKPGAGATFSVYLPVCHRAAQAIEAPALREGATAGATVLLAEDEPAVRRLVRRMLEEHGLHVTEARDGLEALALAADAGQPFDVLLTDLVMPQLGGAELALRLRHDQPELRVVFMSGYPLETHGEGHGNGAESGAPRLPGAESLQKPFSKEELLDRIRAVLEPESSGSGAARPVDEDRG